MNKGNWYKIIYFLVLKKPLPIYFFLFFGGTSSTLVPDIDLATTNIKITDPAIKGKAFKAFKHLYYVQGMALKAPKDMLNEGFYHVEKLWRLVSLNQMEYKRKSILALLYLLFGKYGISITLNQFLKSSDAYGDNLWPCIKLIENELNLKFQNTASTYMDAIETLVNESCEFILENMKDKLKDAKYYACKLAKIIHEKEWISIRKSYTVIVAVTSSIISTQFIVNNIQGLKKTSTKKYKRYGIRYENGQCEKLCCKLCVRLRDIRKHMKDIYEKLYQAAEKLPWKPSHVSPENVFTMLHEIFENHELVFEESASDEIDNFAAFNEARSDMKKNIIRAVQNYMEAVLPRFENLEGLSVRLEDFVHCLKDLYISGKSDIDGNNSILLAEDEEKVGYSLNIVVENDSIKINGIEFSVHYIELIKDLVLAGCSTDELLENDYIRLVQTYIDLIGTNGEEDIPPLDEEEVENYIKTQEDIEISGTVKA